MKAKELAGKLAIRTKPIILGNNDFTGEEEKDYSYTTSPINIIRVTENHIIYNFIGTPDEKIFGKEFKILDDRWNDDNWEDYKELTKGLEVIKK